ncbi:MAG: hypothetical protein AAFQ98_04780 [Bacteroidota bacterium]
MEPITRQIVLERPDIRLVHIPELQVMMMEHLGNAKDADYREVFGALPELYDEYPWKVAVSNELAMKTFPSGTRMWMATKYVHTARVKKMLGRTHLAVTIKSQNAFGATMGNLLHQVLKRVTGYNMKRFQTEKEAFQHIEERYGVAHQELV